MSVAKISVAGMRDVVRGLEEGVETLRSAQSSLRGHLNRFGVDSSRSSGISPAIDWAVAELPGVRRRLALAEALEGSNPTWSVGSVQMDDERDISSVPPEEATLSGQEAAARLRDARGVPDEELLQQIEAMKNDPYFASGFASEMSQEELAETIVGLSNQRWPNDGSLDQAALAERNAWYARVLNSTGTTLGTATRATGDLALPAGYADGWVKEMTREVYSALTPDGDGRPDHANALGVLLTAGTYSTTFLGTVSTGVYDYERKFQDEHPGAVWAPRSAEPGLYGLYDAEGQLFRDPMAGVLAALSKNPEAAQDFFTGGARVTVDLEGQELEVGDRLAYLIQERTWAVDPTNGGYLGSALEAATTVLRDRSVGGLQSAQIASQTFALIGDRTGDGKDGGFLGLGADDGWEMWDGLRPHVAAMLASYGADVHRVVVVGDDDLAMTGWSEPGSGSLFPDDLPYGATLNKKMLEQIVGTLGQEQDDFTPFLAGMFQAGNLAMATGLKRGMDQQPNAGANFLTGGISDDSNPSITNSATVIGWALNTGYGGDKGDEEMQKKRMEAIADALSLASDLPFVPEIKSEWLKFGVDQGKDQALDAIKGSTPSESIGTYSELDADARNSLRDSTANLLLQNGYLDQRAIDGAAERGFVFEPPPEAAIVRSPTGEALRFDTDSAAYNTWVASSSVRSILEESVIGVYADQWAVIR